MKAHRFSKLFPKKKEPEKHVPTRQAKQAVFLLFLVFLLLYFNYKPYNSVPHRITGITEYLFTIYQFVISQTLGIIHEAGHGVCYVLPCPKFLMVLNGTLFQWLFPLGVAYYYKKRDNRTGFYIGLFILGISMDYTAWYMSTALQGPIVPASKSFLGVDGLHDFYYLFHALGVLSYASGISMVTKLSAHLLMIGAVIAMFFDAFPNHPKKETT